MLSTGPWLVLLAFSAFYVDAQINTASDRSQQELALLDWSAGMRMAYCQDLSIQELVGPFLEAMTRMVNRHCRNATACRLRGPVQFSMYHVILLDDFPRRENRAVNFRFFIVLPPDAVPIDKNLEKPMLSTAILADILRVQMSEFTRRLGWQILSYEKFPRFDRMTNFMNRALIPIGVIAGIFMLFLAYWSSTMSSSSTYATDGWMVSGSSGGKNAALRRTLEIINEQKYQDEQERKLQMALERREALAARIALAEAGRAELVPNISAGAIVDPDDSPGYPGAGDVPEIVVMPAMDGSGGGGSMEDGEDVEDLPLFPVNPISAPRRQSFMRHPGTRNDNSKRKRSGVFVASSSRPDRQKRWKTGSLMLHSFGGSRD